MRDLFKAWALLYGSFQLIILPAPIALRPVKLPDNPAKTKKRNPNNGSNLFRPQPPQIPPPFPNLFKFHLQDSSFKQPLYKFRLSSPPLSKLSNPRPFSSSAFASSSSTGEEELIFFGSGAHYRDLVANLLLGFTLLWLPLTLAAVFRAFFLRYRFTNRRVTVISGFTGDDRTDFPYSAVTDVQVVPRLIGEWGDIVISLRDGTKVDLRSVPHFREVADYCLLMKEEEEEEEKRAGGGARRGF